MDYHIEIRETEERKPRPRDEELRFGEVFTDHMFIMRYAEGRGWHDAEVVPYGPLSLPPAAACFHYGQTAFEGMKAYRTDDGRDLLFRPVDNARRLNVTAQRLCMPRMDEELFVRAVQTAVSVDRDWIPTAPETSLYIRPFVIATEENLALKPSSSYFFVIIMSPVGPYYRRGIAPTRILVETEHVRSVTGGVGAAKTGGNYARGLKAEVRAAADGYDQVLWLDGRERRYAEEVGTMNVFFRIDDVIITPPLRGTILPGITRYSVLTLLSEWDVEVQEREISLQEIAGAHRAGVLQEAFGTGTAAVISPMGRLSWDGTDMNINDGRTGELTARLYETLTGIQRGRIEDRFGWTVEVPSRPRRT
ncbi:MAG: branched-chain amino acid aminotransferase [Bacillota bacterium]